MTDADKIISRNIRCLRAAYGESQLDLALEIGLNSPNTIANYEKGIRYPKPEIRKKIAIHYRITEEELAHNDFSGLHFSKSIFRDKEKMLKMTALMFPIVKTEQAMENATFKMGYEAHLRVWEASKTQCVAEDNDYDICVDSYANAFERDKIPEALVNILGLILMAEISMKNKWMIDGAKALNEKRISGDDFLKRFYLRNCEFESEEQQIPEDMTPQDMKEYEDFIIEMLKKLKKIAAWSNLADYYTALRYMMGCITNELTDDMNKTVGCEMMWAFVQLGNPYAKQLFLRSIKNNRKQKYS